MQPQRCIEGFSLLAFCSTILNRSLIEQARIQNGSICHSGPCHLSLERPSRLATAPRGEGQFEFYLVR
jgi:hypothetical protein